MLTHKVGIRFLCHLRPPAITLTLSRAGTLEVLRINPLAVDALHPPIEGSAKARCSSTVTTPVCFDTVLPASFQHHSAFILLFAVAAVPPRMASAEL